MVRLLAPPKHPAGEGKSGLFHVGFAAIGLAHVLGGVLMIWFHGVAGWRHAKDWWRGADS